MKNSLMKATILVICAVCLTTANSQAVNLQQQGDYTVGTAINTPRFAVGDVNNDCLPDLVTLNPSNLSTVGPISVFLNNGAGGFGTPFEASIAPATSSTEMNIAVIDTNRDGRDDLLIGRQGGFLLYHGNSNLSVRTENDFDADGKTDFAVFRNGIWYILKSLTNTPIYRQCGLAGGVVVPGDYNGDGVADTAVYRSSEQRWYVPPCANYGQQFVSFGVSGDIPLPSLSAL